MEEPPSDDFTEKFLAQKDKRLKRYKSSMKVRAAAGEDRPRRERGEDVL